MTYTLHNQYFIFPFSHNASVTLPTEETSNDDTTTPVDKNRADKKPPKVPSRFGLVS